MNREEHRAAQREAERRTRGGFLLRIVSHEGRQLGVLRDHAAARAGKKSVRVEYVVAKTTNVAHERDLGDSDVRRAMTPHFTLRRAVPKIHGKKARRAHRELLRSKSGRGESPNLPGDAA